MLFCAPLLYRVIFVSFFGSTNWSRSFPLKAFPLLQSCSSLSAPPLPPPPHTHIILCVNSRDGSVCISQEICSFWITQTKSLKPATLQWPWKSWHIPFLMFVVNFNRSSLNVSVREEKKPRQPFLWLFISFVQRFSVFIHPSAALCYLSESAV